MHELSLARLLESPEPNPNATSAASSRSTSRAFTSVPAPVRVATPIRFRESLQRPVSRPSSRSVSSLSPDSLKTKSTPVVEAPSVFADLHAPSIFSASPSFPPFLRALPVSATSPEAARITSSPSSTGENPTSISNSNSPLYRDGELFSSRPQLFAKHVQASAPRGCLTCNICQQSFATKDFLTRHIANHQNDSPKKRRRISGTESANQVSQPCRLCATARVECDNFRPCRRCVRWKLGCLPFSELSSTTAVPLNQRPLNNGTAAPRNANLANSHTQKYNNREPSLTKRSLADAHDLTNKTTPDPEGTFLKAKDGKGQNRDTGHIESTTPLPTSSRGPFCEILLDVLYQQPPNQGAIFHSQNFIVLDFCDDANLQLEDADFSHLALWNMETTARGKLPVPIVSGTYPQNPVEISQMRRNVSNIWSKSPWQWKAPQHEAEKPEWSDFLVPDSETNSAIDMSYSVGIRSEGSQNSPERVADEKLDQSTRDGVLAMAMAIYHHNSMGKRLAASFPVVDVMAFLVQTFLTAHRCQVLQWIHCPSLTLNSQCSEWVAVAAATGAILTAIPSLCKFGFELQETAEIAMTSRLEGGCGADRENLVPIQTVVLGQDLGIWSANRRKMMISESRRIIPVTLMRHCQKFQYSSYPQIIVDASDEGEMLNTKWKLWVEKEQWKRLVFHCYIREAQLSMTNWTNPCMSYAELLLPLPEAKELWFAETASEWKKLYLQKSMKQSEKALTIGDLFHDIHQIPKMKGQQDMQLSLSVFLYAFWSMILEYCQLSAVHSFRSYCKESADLLLSFRHQELVKFFQKFLSLSRHWHEMSAQEHMMANLLMMNLHVSLDDLQLFLGKHGDDEARRVYPMLQEWVSSHDGRSAIWYAGQVLRYAKMFPPGHLRDFYAVAVYHASLGLWTYGVIFRANRKEAMMRQCRCESVYLDGENTMAMQRFLESEERKPLIQDPGVGSGDEAGALLYDTARCMDVVHQILQHNFGTAEVALPPIVENLCQLIKQLGKLARAISPSWV